MRAYLEVEVKVHDEERALGREKLAEVGRHDTDLANHRRRDEAANGCADSVTRVRDRRVLELAVQLLGLEDNNGIVAVLGHEAGIRRVGEAEGVLYANGRKEGETRSE